MNKLIICKNCGIKFEDTKEACPVCNFCQSSNAFLKTDQIEERIIRKGWRNFVLIITFFMILTPCLTVLAINLAQNQSISWSLLIIHPLIVSWLYLFLVLKLHKTPLLLGIGLILLTVFFLYILNLLQQGTWFLSFGLPLSIGIPIISYIFISLINKTKNRPPSVIALFIMGLETIAIYIDLVFSIATYQTISLSWSIIVLGASIPLVIVLFYLNKHKKVLHKWFYL